MLAEREVGRAIVLGVSMGGYTALAFAARHPERLAALVLADTRAAADGAEARAGRAVAIDAIRRPGRTPISPGASPVCSPPARPPRA